MFLRTLLTLSICSITLAILAQNPRQLPPVILTGADLPDLIEYGTDQIAGFKYQNENWVPIPIQIDERDTRIAFQLYDSLLYDDFDDYFFLVYTSPDFFTGPDTNPLFDVNDELVFMAKDAGGLANTQDWPDGTTGPPSIIEIDDPITSHKTFVYLFPQDGSLPLDAGDDYVSYEYNLLSGDYKETYIMNESNPEDSWINTNYYSQHFSDDWIKDVLKIYAGSSTGVDILDHAKILLGLGICNRNIETFSESTGIQVCSKDGPVRAIRSTFGANSGPFIERNHFFYEQMEVLDFWMRLHFIRGFMRFYDLSEDALNMTYYDKFRQNGLNIDGSPEPFDQQEVSKWLLYTGEQGSLLKFDSIYTTFPIDTFWMHYEDADNPIETQCTGDEFAIGAAGHWLLQMIPDTDPRSGSTDVHYYKETSYFLNPDLNPGSTFEIRDQHRKPLLVTVKDSLSALPAFQYSYSKIKVFPNPTQGLLNLDFDEALGPFTITLIQLDGRVVQQYDTPQNKTLQLPNGLSSGIYILKLQGENFIETKRIILE